MFDYIIDSVLTPYCRLPHNTTEPQCSFNCRYFSRCGLPLKKQVIATFKYSSEEDSEQPSSEPLTINGIDYSMEQLYEIITEYQKSQGLCPIKCDLCGNTYVENKKYDIYSVLKRNPLSNSLSDEDPSYITGIKLMSTKGDCAEIKMCDNCLDKLIVWYYTNVCKED